MPDQRVPLWTISLALVIALALAAVFGGIARWMLRGRASLSMTASIVMSLLGSALGFGVAWLLRPTASAGSPLAVTLAFFGSLLAVVVYAAVAAHFQRPVPETTVELLRGGESDRVEFKSTARINLHTGKKDPRMEQVVAKTLAGFLNSDGGPLIIGVNDEGVPLGLDADMATMKVPDRDRYELWLRDWLIQALGPNAAGLVVVEFESLPDEGDVHRDVLRVTAPSSPLPVYMRAQKNAEPQFWVRTGNSTRQLHVDAAAEYVAHRWPLSVGTSMAAQFRATMRFSGGR